MKLFIGSKEIDKPATPRFFNILDIDTPSLRARELRVYQTDAGTGSGDMRNWGFAWHGNHLYAPNRRRGLVKYDRNLNTVANFHGSFADSAVYKPGQSMRPNAQFDRPHQIACIGDRIFICDSGHNLLKIFDIETEKFQTLAFGADKNWINSINLIDDEYNIVFHNHGWSDLLVLGQDLKPRYEKKRIGVCAHNIWSMNGERWTCSSREGKLRSIDADQTIELGGYPRGIALHDKFLIVGLSRVRPSDSLTVQSRRIPASSDTQPQIATSGLLILDSETHAVLANIEFGELLDDPAYCMPYIFEIRVVDEPDGAVFTNECLRFGDISQFLQREIELEGGA